MVGAFFMLGAIRAIFMPILHIQVNPQKDSTGTNTFTKL